MMTLIMTRKTSSAVAPHQTANLASLCIEVVRARFEPASGPIRLPENLDPHSLIEFARRHGATTALAGGLKNAGMEGSYAAGLQMMLTAVEASNAKRNSAIRLVLSELGQKFCHHNIPCVALKGGAFVAEAETVPGWRSLSDLDVLVPPTKLPKAAEILFSNNYSEAIPGDDYRETDRHHFTPLVPPGADFAVELHTRFVWDEVADPLDPADVLARALPSKVLGVSVPRAEHRVIHLIAHGQLGDKAYAARRILLKDIVDYGELVQGHDIDWTEVERAFVVIGKRPVMSGFLKAAAIVLQDAAPTTRLDLSDGYGWAQQAVDNFLTGRSDHKGAAIDIARDYASRVLFRKGGMRLLLSTLLDRERLLRLWDTQARKWRS